MPADPFRLDGRSVAVVGAGSGIGAAIAIACGERGASVACLDLRREGAEATAASIRASGGSAESGQLDIRDSEGVASSFGEVRERHGSLDGMVCTPSINVRKPLLDYTEEEFERVLDLNLKGSFLALTAAGRIMRQQGSGSIVLFSSIRAVVVEPGQGAYAATKAGIVQMVRTLAAELGGDGVRVNAVGPGVVDTPLTRPIRSDPDWYQAYADRSALGRWARAEEMAGPTVFLLSDASSYVTGTIVFVDGGWTAIDGRFTPPGM